MSVDDFIHSLYADIENIEKKIEQVFDRWIPYSILYRICTLYQMKLEHLFSF